MPKIALTDLSVRRLSTPRQGQIAYWDTSLPNFGIRISHGGTKTFVVLLGGGKRKTIGRYPVVSLATARAGAKHIFAQRTLGHLLPKSVTFDEALTLFLATRAQRNKPRTVADYTRLLNKHFSHLNQRRLADISTSDVLQVVDRLLSAPSEALHAFVAARAFFGWAARRNLVQISPCARVQPPATPPARDRVLTDGELVAVFAGAIRDGYPYGLIVVLLALTGQRKNEIASLRWEWIDTTARTITLPAQATKNNRQHTFPYGQAAADILAAIPRQGGLLFPARGNPDASFSGWSKCKARLDLKLTHVQPWRLHDLRRTFATNLAALGTPVHVTERLLNHVSGIVSGVAAIYNRHSYMDEMRAAVLAWEEHLQRLIAT